ncbi:EF-hand calcium-binding domain-containing 14 isoform X2, putative [Babesia ovis]|uniref:EF-hand calcium-binding domain-containing 14 isoform X2, putative n=1 Tax=Babesia ovis TaxID=5869 RepID=A0A9W5TET9_BABOV|nr:EF-hand calcium-binding domain-containing 14 isoform X2, putative [Babesia ovis]
MVMSFPFGKLLHKRVSKSVVGADKDCSLDAGAGTSVHEDVVPVEVDVLREFYLSRLGVSPLGGSDTVDSCQRCGSVVGSVPSTPCATDAATTSTDSTTITLPTGSGAIDRELLSRVSTLNEQLDRYYRVVNEDCRGVPKLGSDDPLSRIYLGSSSSWPRPSELLNITDATGTLSEALRALDERDALCRKILAVQHCHLLALTGCGGHDGSARQPASLVAHLTDAQLLHGDPESNKCSDTTGTEQEHPTSETHELQRLRRIIQE